MEQKYSLALRSLFFPACTFVHLITQKEQSTVLKQSNKINIWFRVGISYPQTHHTSQLRLERGNLLHTAELFPFKTAAKMAKFQTPTPQNYLLEKVVRCLLQMRFLQG